MHDPSDREPVRTGAPPFLWAFVGMLAIPEIVFQLAEAGILAAPRLRETAFLLGAFWDLEFDATLAGSEVPWTFWTSFVTYAFLHGDALHFLMNAALILALGNLLIRALGPGRFLMLSLISAIAGAFVFGVLAEARGPMVGASGVVFGYFGALKAWEWRYNRATGASSQRFWRTIIALILMNVLLAIFYPNASIAWEAHLGGFLAGFVAALWLAPRLAAPSPI